MYNHHQYHQNDQLRYNQQSNAEDWNHDFDYHTNNITVSQEPTYNTREFIGGGNFPQQHFQHHPRHHQKRRRGSHRFAVQSQLPNWGKRSYEQAASLSPASSSSTVSESRSESSPTPKRSFQKQSSLEMKPPQAQQNNKMLEAIKNQGPKTNGQKTNLQNLQKPPQQQQQRKPFEHPTVAISNLKEKEWIAAFNQAVANLEACHPGEEISTLLWSLQPSRSTWSALKELITSDMTRMLTPLNVNSVMVFGSTLTGLDFIGSDLDFHIQLKKPPMNEDEARLAINRTRKLLHSQSEFRFVISVPNARVPIIRLLHQRTTTICDINFTSRFGYYNSCFIGSILSYDIRIKELAVILKLWGKSYKTTDKLNLSNYCLIMLMTFYLQNLEEPMLDTIMNSQKSRRPQVLDPKHKWNIYFNDSINFASRNQLTTRELLVGFFEFYTKLNYSRYIVSPYTGDLIRREEFATHPDMSEYRRIVAESQLAPLKYENPDLLVVQDGFELSVNIGIKSCKKHAESLFELIRISHLKCLELQNEPFSMLLTKLLTDLKVPELTIGSDSQRKSKKFPITLHACAGDLKLCQDILKAEDKQKVYSEDDQQAFFFNHVCEGTQKFLSEVYLCLISAEVELAQPKPMHKEFKIELHVDTINQRKKINFKDDATLQADIELSKKMCANKIQLQLDVNAKISTVTKGKIVNLELIDNSTTKKSALSNFGSCLNINLMPALRFYLKKKWTEATNNVLDI